MHIQGPCGTKDVWNHGIQNCDASCVSSESKFELEEGRLDYPGSCLRRQQSSLAGGPNLLQEVIPSD